MDAALLPSRKLTVGIITYNEERYIEKLLENVADIADEILIIDSASTDKTISLIRKSSFPTLRLIETPQTPMFIQNKQKIIDEAKYEWILQLDADELLTPELKQEIRDVLQKRDIKNGYLIPRRNFFLTRYLLKGGVYPDSVLRLYKKEKSHFLLKDIHENVQVQGEIGSLLHDLLHDSDPDFLKYLQRWAKYSQYEAKRLYGQNIHLNMFLYLAVYPQWWFLKTYFRHKGFMDGFPGFVFHLFSSLRFIAIYVFWWHMIHGKPSSTTSA